MRGCDKPFKLWNLKLADDVNKVAYLFRRKYEFNDAICWIESLVTLQMRVLICRLQTFLFFSLYASNLSLPPSRCEVV